MKVKIEASWQSVLQDEFDKPYFSLLVDFVHKQYGTSTCFPPAASIFNAFDLCPFNQVKVVILGQDPYAHLGQAQGLCFSVPDGVIIPPSLRNIYKELNDDLQIPPNPSGNLTRWAQQGVLLLNAILTVKEGQPLSHQNKGWEEFTDRVIAELSERCSGLVFLLWGNPARRKGAMIDRKKHLVLEAAHPSPLSASRGFLGCRHFSAANKWLLSQGQTPIQW